MQSDTPPATLCSAMEVVSISENDGLPGSVSASRAGEPQSYPSDATLRESAVDLRCSEFVARVPSAAALLGTKRAAAKPPDEPDPSDTTTAILLLMAAAMDACTLSAALFSGMHVVAAVAAQAMAVRLACAGLVLTWRSMAVGVVCAAAVHAAFSGCAGTLVDSSRSTVAATLSSYVGVAFALHYALHSRQLPASRWSMANLAWLATLACVGIAFGDRDSAQLPAWHPLLLIIVVCGCAAPAATPPTAVQPVLEPVDVEAARNTVQRHKKPDPEADVLEHSRLEQNDDAGSEATSPVVRPVRSPESIFGGIPQCESRYDASEVGMDMNAVELARSRSGTLLTVEPCDQRESSRVPALKPSSAASSPTNKSRAAPRRPLTRYQAVEKNIEWRRGAIIGQGGWGTVHIGLNENSGELMAVKSLSFDPQDPEVKRKIQQLQTEISVMKFLEHRNIVKYYFTEKTGTTMNIFMEYVPGGSLAGYLVQFGKLSTAVAGAYTEQVLIGLTYLHSRSVIHRDIKCANILVTVDGLCKLADFGASAIIDHIGGCARGSMKGTPVWMAPEVAAGHGHDWTCDIWSLGCSVMEMLTAQAPFAHLSLSVLNVLKYVLDHDQIIQLPELTSEAATFVDLCLQRDPRRRPTPADLLNAQFTRGRDHPRSCGSSPQVSPTRAAETAGRSRLTFASESAFTTSSYRRSAPHKLIPPGSPASRVSTASSVGTAISARYMDAVMGRPMRGMDGRDAEKDRLRRIGSVRADCEKRASLMSAPKQRATVITSSDESRADDASDWETGDFASGLFAPTTSTFHRDDFGLRSVSTYTAPGRSTSTRTPARVGTGTDTTPSREA